MAGAIKVNGKWIPKSEIYKKNINVIDTKPIVIPKKEPVKSPELIAALKLADPETGMIYFRKGRDYGLITPEWWASKTPEYLKKYVPRTREKWLRETRKQTERIRSKPVVVVKKPSLPCGS